MKVELLQSRHVSANTRSDIINLRQSSYGEDVWGATDDFSTHLIAFHRGELVGYYRILSWSCFECKRDLVKISPILSVYQFNQSDLAGFDVLELGRLCVRENARTNSVPRLLWRRLKGFFEPCSGASKPVLGLGMITPPAGRDWDLIHDYEIVRFMAPCRVTGHFKPRFSATFVTGSGSPARAPNLAAGSCSGVRLSTVRAYLRIGARFGSLARWPSFDNRPCLLGSMVSHELKL